MTIIDRILAACDETQKQKRRIVCVLLSKADAKAYREADGFRVVHAEVNKNAKRHKAINCFGSDVRQSVYIHAGRGRDRFAEL